MLKKWILMTLLATWANAAPAQEFRVTLDEGTNFSADLSPNGESLVIDLLGSLWTLPNEGGKAQRLTDPTRIEARRPQWSPEGDQIAFQGFLDGFWHLFLIRPGDDAPEQITTGAVDSQGPNWHPGGDKLLFSSNRGGPEDIYEISLETKKVSQISNTAAATFGATWSHTTGALAYIQAEKSSQKVVLRNKDGSERVLLERPGQIDGLSWHPQDTSLTFVHTHNEETGLYLADIGSDGVLALGDPGDDIFPFAGIWQSDKRLIYTADGKIKTLALDTFERNDIPFEAEISLTRPDYARKQHDFTSATPQKTKGILGPVLSPSGDKIAFAALGNLWVQTIGADLQQVTNSSAVSFDPTWSPDGQSLVYVSDTKGVMDIWRVDLASGERTQISQLQSGATAPVLSPDGQSVAFIQALGNPGLGPALPAILDLATGKTRPLSTPLWGPGRPSWSPNGRWITLSAQPDPASRIREGLNQILLISKDGKTKSWLAAPSGKSLAMRNRNGPLWLDDTSIIFVEGGAVWSATLSPTQNQIKNQRLLLRQPGLVSSISLSGDKRLLSFLEDDMLKIGAIEDLLNGQQPELISVDMEWVPDIPAGRKIVHAGKLFDGISETYLSDMDIVIDGNVITSVRPHTPHDANADIIDASSQTVIPGLFDMHVHQHAGLGEQLGRVWLSFGVTSVREPGANPYDALERKESWASGTRPGPRQFFAGGQLDGPLTYFAFSHPTSSAQEINKEMRRAEKLGYDFIKTYIRLSEDRRRNVIEQAHAIGLPVTAHDFFPAAAFGGDGVEHMRGTSRRGFSPKLSNTNRAYDDVIKIIGAAGMTQTPTLVVRGGFALLARTDASLLLNAQYQSLYPAGQRKMMEGMAFGIAGDLDRARIRLERHFTDVLNLKESGARITAGTDVPIVPYGLSLHAELQLLKDAGLTPAQVLQSATINAAHSLGVEKWLGSLAAGKLADLVIVNGDPLETIAETRNVTAVIQNGKLYRTNSLINP